VISTADVLELLWSETEREDPPPQDQLDRAVEAAFVDLLREMPRFAPLLYRPYYGLDPYVRAWAASVEMPPRWAAALHLRLGLVTGQPLDWTEVGKRLGVSKQRAAELAAQGLAEYWRLFDGRAGEKLNALREEARRWLIQDARGAEQSDTDRKLYWVDSLDASLYGPPRAQFWNPSDVGADDKGHIDTG
jgi:hypothetical protein